MSKTIAHRWPAARILSVALGIATVLAAGVEPVRAATVLGAAPSRYDVSVAPGQSTSNAVWVTNEGTTAFTVRSYVMDRGFRGGISVFDGPGNTFDSLAAWVSPSPREFTLAPGMQQQVTWEVTVPAQASPGDHSAVLFFDTTPRPSPGTVAVGGRVGTVINLRVPGETVLSGRLLGVVVAPASPSVGTGGDLSRGPEPGPRRGTRAFLNWAWGDRTLAVSATFENTGNVRLPVSGQAVVRNVLGRHVGDLKSSEPVQVFPRSTGGLTLGWEPPPAPGLYRVETRFQMGKEEVSSRKMVLVFPGRRTMSFIFIGLGGALLLSQGRRRAGGTATASPTTAG